MSYQADQYCTSKLVEGGRRLHVGQVRSARDTKSRVRWMLEHDLEHHSALYGLGQK